MKIAIFYIFSCAWANGDRRLPPIPITDRATKEFVDLMKNGPLLLDHYFGPDAHPVRPKRAEQFVERYKRHLAKQNERMANAWNECGRSNFGIKLWPRILRVYFLTLKFFNTAFCIFNIIIF